MGKQKKEVRKDMTVADKTNVCGQMRGSDENSRVGEQNQKSSPSNSIKSESR